MGAKHGSAEERLFRRVNKSGDGCWLWTGCRNARGYGRINVDGETRQAHRVAYELAHGPIAPGLSVCHKCDTPACVRPDHLFAATHYENMQDMTRKGRASDTKGEKCGKAILTTVEVQEIIERLAAGEYGTDLAREHGVSNTAIYSIKHRRRWAHVPREVFA